MSKNKYWQDRFIEEEERLNKIAGDEFRRQQLEYERAIARMNKDIEVWYNRIAKNNDVSLAEAKKMLNDKELKEFKWTLDEYIKYGKENGIDKNWNKELENASARVHIERLEAMKLQVRGEIEKLYNGRESGFESYLKNLYKDQYNRTAFQIAKGTGVGTNIYSLNDKLVNTVIKKPWAPDGKNFSDRIWEDKDKLINTLHTEMTQAFIRGDSLEKLADKIAEKMKASKANASRLVYTESAAYSSRARLKSYQDLGVEKYEIVATLDNRTSDICQDMDGKVFDLKDYEVGVTANPFHVRCRTTTAPYFDDMEGERSARNEKTGETEYVPADITYKDWKEKYLDNNSELTDKPKKTSKKQKTLDDINSIEEMEEFTKSQNWFYKNDSFNSNELLSYEGMELEAAKSVHKTYEKVFERYPQMKGRLAAFNTHKLKDPKHFANCNIGTGQGGITFNKIYYGNLEKFKKQVAKLVERGYFPEGTTWEGITMHEIGHAVDDFLSFNAKVFGEPPNKKIASNLVSSKIRPKIFRKLKLQIGDIAEKLSDYATTDAQETFAEAFSEFMTSPKPRELANEYGKTIDEMFSKIEVEDSFKGLSSGNKTVVLEKDVRYRKLGNIKNTGYNNPVDLLRKYEQKIVKNTYESAMVITESGEIYVAKGDASSISLHKMNIPYKNSYFTHNHPEGLHEWGLSNDDFTFFTNYELRYMAAIDEKYIHELSRNLFEMKDIDLNMDPRKLENVNFENVAEVLQMQKAKEKKLKYRRKRHVVKKPQAL
nr:MAG TPA: minor capsid protein [Caudoviricetes sp.]